MDAILRFDGATKRDEAVDAWLHLQVPHLGAIATEWFERMRACGDDVRELVHDGFPTACVEDAPFAYVNVLKAHVNVGFFHGADIDDPRGLFEGNGKHMRHVKIRPGAEVETAALQSLVEAAYADIKWRLEIE